MGWHRVTSIKRKVPRPIKHPLFICTEWYWAIRQLPAQSLGDMVIIKEMLASVEGDRVNVLEWGSGASTTYYPKYLRSIGREFEWHAMENSSTWHRRIEEKVRRSNLTGQVHIHCSEFPRFSDLPGYRVADPVPPQSYSQSAEVTKYVETPRELGSKFDVIIVDGRFRRRCLMVAKDVLAPNGVVLLHDAQKTQYHSSLSSFSHVKFLETGAMPGISQQSTIALCCIGEDTPIRGF
jgi:hypothetical protein